MKRFAVLWLLLLTSFSFMRPRVLSDFSMCSFSDDDSPSRPSFLFDPELTAEPGYRPLYFTWNQFYEDWGADRSRHDSNLREWEDYFKGSLSRSEIDSLIYQFDTAFLQSLKCYITECNIPDTARGSFWKCARALKNAGDRDFLDYLIFARACEPLVDYLPWWSQKKEGENRAKMLELAYTGRKQLDACRSDVLKLRYGYQLVRLAHYAGEWKLSAAWYDTLVAPSKVLSVIKYWSLEQKAGALRSLGMEAEAAHLFSVVFDQCPERREASLLSFRIRSDSVWNACMALCESPREKTTLCFLRALSSDANTLEEMKTIESIDPSSDQLNVLLVRDINEIEDQMFHVRKMDPYEEYWDRQEPKTTYPDDMSQDLHAFIAACLGSGKVRNPVLWKLALGYTEYLMGKVDESRRTLTGLLQASRDTTVRREIDLFLIGLNVAKIQHDNRYVEDTLFVAVNETGHEKLQQHFLNTMESVCAADGETARSLLCNHDIRFLQHERDIEAVDRLIAWNDRKDKTAFDNFLASERFGFESPGVALSDLKGTILFGQNRLQEAVESFKETHVPSRLRADPFSIRIKDCRDCDFAEFRDGKFDKQTVAESILVLQRKIVEDPAHSARYHFLLGNAYYNITYFGNCTEALVYERNADLMWHFEIGEHPGNNFFDCSRARACYDSAMHLAEGLGDMELAAECAFMAAKCEQNTYYTTVKKDEDGRIKNSTYRTYFSRLKKEYSNTAFYARAINECKYFSTFAWRK